MKYTSLDSFHCQDTLTVNGQVYHFYNLQKAKSLPDISKLPVTLKILLENVLRYENTGDTPKNQAVNIANWLQTKQAGEEIAYRPARILMQDFTGVPAIVDLAAMRDAMKKLGGDPNKINPLSPVDLVVDHSVQVDSFANQNAFEMNVEKEMERNVERYEFLRWGQNAFNHFRVVPPGTGICHQVNLEYLGQGVFTETVEDKQYVMPDTLVGTDSHTTMINGLGALGWGVGGIEAEAAMLGQPISLRLPEVIGVELTGRLPEGITATDLVLTITQILRAKGVVGKFVEFFGSGLANLSLADRATIANMAPEYGATCGFFPIDSETIHYLTLSGRDEQQIALVEAYCKAQGIWHDESTPASEFTDTVSLDLSTVVPALAGPKRPQDKVTLSALPTAVDDLLKEAHKSLAARAQTDTLQNGDIVIAAITSCTNTSNPSVLMAAGLLAKKAVEKGLQRKPWVKSSLAPGSKVVTDYLTEAGLQTHLDALGFNLVGYGCTTCIGNSGPLPEAISQAINDDDLMVCAVLSGNRNFEGRIHPQVKANWLASPPLVVAYALAGTARIDLQSDPIAHNPEGEAIYLKDIWPSNHEIQTAMHAVKQTMFKREYSEVFKGDVHWQGIEISKSKTYQWQETSSYVQHPPYFIDLTATPAPVSDIKNANILALLGDSVTTDHISPAGVIKPDSPAGLYLQNLGVKVEAFNSYGARRGNHKVMMRGTFANIRIRNKMLPGTEGGITKYIPSGETLSIFDAAMRYQESNTPLIVIAGKEYGTGSSRDWAAKGTRLLGVKAVIAESFERIHRSNLIGMGVLPLMFPENISANSLNLTGEEVISIDISNDILSPRMTLEVTVQTPEGKMHTLPCLLRIDTETELNYYKHDGILPYVLRQLAT